MTSAERPRIPGQVIRRLPLLLLVFVGLTVWRLNSEPDPEVSPMTTLAGSTMGTTFSIKVGAHLDDKQLAQMAKAVRSALGTVDDAMSTYREDSELSAFNQQTATDDFPVSEPLRQVLEVALIVGERSGGALDITVGPLVAAYGFGPDEPGTPPDADTLATLREHVGLDKLKLSEQGLRKQDGRVQCDLSAIAKGYAVDLVAKALETEGVTNYLVEVGGEIRTRGHRPDGTAFRVGIEHPDPERRALALRLPLENRAMATSGDYRNFFLEDGQRHSHILDPRTGQPVRHNLASVTVVHKDTVWADAWATALLVLGPDKGPELAEAQGLAAYFIVRETPEDTRTLETPAFGELLAPPKPADSSAKEAP